MTRGLGTPAPYRKKCPVTLERDEDSGHRLAVIEEGVPPLPGDVEVVRYGRRDVARNGGRSQETPPEGIGDNTYAAKCAAC